MATPIRRYFANGAPAQTLASPITSGAIALSTAGSFTGWPVSFPFFAVIDRLTPSAEIVLVTAIVGTTASITRAQDGSVAVAHAAGATFEQCVVQRDLDEANAHTNATTGVHGVVGAVVGTTDTQTLTNKTLTAPALGAATASSLTASGTVTSGSISTGAIAATTVTASGAVTAASVTAPVITADRVQLHWTNTQAIANVLTTLISTGCVVDYDSATAPMGSTLGSVTIQVTGTYEVSGRVCTNATTGTSDGGIYKNTSTAVNAGVGSLGAARSVAVFAPREIPLTAGDIITLRWSDSSVPTLDNTAGRETFLRVKRIS